MKLYMLRNIFTREQTVPKYKYMEVESELDSTKDQVIADLRDHIRTLQRDNASLRYQLELKDKEEPVVEQQPMRRKVSSISELSSIMEAASIERKRKNDEKNNPKHSS